MSFIFIRCELCNEIIATADADTLRRPMRGSMFLSPDPWHGVPAPFAPDTEWVGMRCPYGNHRPFMAEDAVLLDSGDTWPVEYPDPPKPLDEMQASDGNGEGNQQDVKVMGPQGDHFWPTAQAWTCAACGFEAKSNAGLSAHTRAAH